MDVFDALTSKRPYKTAWSIEDAWDYMKKHRRTHYDLFFKNLSEVHKIKEVYRDE